MLFFCTHAYSQVFSNQGPYTWVEVFRIIPEIRFLRLTFHRKSVSKSRIWEIIIASGIYYQSVKGLFQKKKYLGGEEGKQYIFLWVVGADIFSNYMGHWCLKKSDYMGGGVLSENW